MWGRFCFIILIGFNFNIILVDEKFLCGMVGLDINKFVII